MTRYNDQYLSIWLALSFTVYHAMKLLEAAVAMANKIASFSRPAVAMAKETVNAAYELSLEEGTRFERRIFHSMFSTADQKEGMAAFIEKRAPQWTHK